MPRVVLVFALFFSLIDSMVAQNIPTTIIGKWRVRRILPADTVSCWGEKEARGLLGTEIEYTADSFRWKADSIQHPTVHVTVVTADEFQKEYSGSGSFVDFRRLGIPNSKATKVQIVHPPASITQGSIEVPGDNLLIKNRKTIVFSVCNVYFEAKRE